MVISLLKNRSRGQHDTLPPSRSPFSRASALFLSLFFSSLCVVMVIKAKGGGVEAVVGLVVSWELGRMKWSDSCTHKQCVRWSRREVGAGVGQSTRRKERGPGGEQREEPIPRVLALLLDSMFSTITSWSPCCLRHTAVEQHSSRKMGKWAPGKCHLLLKRGNAWSEQMSISFTGQQLSDISVQFTSQMIFLLHVLYLGEARGDHCRSSQEVTHRHL